MYASENELVASCWNRRWEHLCWCLRQGHPVDLTDDNGVTPLQICAALGWTDAVSMLLKHGADINLTCPLGWTALMQAVRNGHADTVEILFDAGANITAVNSLGWDVVSLAVASHNNEVLVKLLRKANSSELNLALSLACQMGRIDAVRILMDHNANINKVLPISNLTPLMLAASEGHENIVQILLSMKANPHNNNSCNLTALDMALINGHNTIASMLSLHTRIKSPINSPSHFPNTLKITINPNGVLSQGPNGTCWNSITPRSQTPIVRSGSPQIFKFPPSPNYADMYPTLHPYSQASVLRHPPTPFSAYSISPSSCHCRSPSHAPSPIIPPWMFSFRRYKVEPKIPKKSTRHMKNWWNRLKRRLTCKGKKQKESIKIYVSFDKASKASFEGQFEELLSSLNLESLAPILKSHEIDAETFQHLREKDLEEIGIVDKDLQCSILQKIRSLNDNILTSGAL